MAHSPCCGRVEGLEAEIERLGRDRAEVVEALGPHAHPGLSPAANVAELRQRAEAAEARVERLRIAAQVYLDSGGHPEYEQDLRAALRGKP